MTIIVDKAYIEAGQALAKEYEASLRQLFRKAYGHDGDRRLDVMIAKMQDNIASDSVDPATAATGKET